MTEAAKLGEALRDALQQTATDEAPTAPRDRARQTFCAEPGCTQRVTGTRRCGRHRRGKRNAIDNRAMSGLASGHLIYR